MPEFSNTKKSQTKDNIYANNMQSTNVTQLKNNVIKPKSKRHQAYDLVKEWRTSCTKFSIANFTTKFNTIIDQYQT